MGATTAGVTDDEIIEAFWAAVPDTATVDDFADGIDVTFTVADQTHTVHTKVVRTPRITPMADYAARVERTAVAKVRSAL